jgi:hypothetical protein
MPQHEEDPSAEITDSFEHHKGLREITVDVYSQQRTEAFFCDYYDSDTKDAFVNLRHPAEQSDFLRPHVVYAYGGYYRDADLKIDSMERFLQLASSSHHAMFSIMETCLVDNGFFGARKGSRLMASCIDISLTNCDLYLRLPIDMKTGLGAFTRMLAREFFRVMAFGEAITQMKIIDRDEWRRIIGIYPVSYKGDQCNRQIVQAHNGIT